MDGNVAHNYYDSIQISVRFSYTLSVSEYSRGLPHTIDTQILMHIVFSHFYLVLSAQYVLVMTRTQGIYKQLGPWAMLLINATVS